MEVIALFTDLDRGQLPSSARLLDKGPRPGPSRSRRSPDQQPAPVLIEPSGHALYLTAKRGVEIMVASALLVLSAPIILLSALLVKLTSRGPAFYTQTRVGRNGQLFTIYKIRTMVHDCESLTGPRWSIPGDPRITRVGQFLRRSHFDELPQLLNVLRGDMSIIGPRPERPEFLPKLERVLPQYRNRLAVRPGITGLAQVHLAADTEVENVRRKLVYDLYYIRHLSLWLDVRILFGTIFYVLGDRYQLCRKLHVVPRSDEVEGVPPPTPAEAELVRERICA
jgi:lipopolysaccharide/colanic/teichoic acid biosynthesis glycosyltransferase